MEDPAQHASGKGPDLPTRLTYDDLANLWRVTVRTIQRRVAEGKAPQPVKTGGRKLFRREDVLAWEAGDLAETDKGQPE